VIRVSAPGKTILMGEHAAVYGRPALVAAVDQRLTVTLEPLAAAGEVRLELPQVGVRERASWGALRAYARRCRAAWEAYAANPGPERFAAVRGSDPAHLVKIALGETALARGDAETPSFALRLESQIPIGAGFGSSAAVAVAVVYAVLRLAGDDPPVAELERLALEVERRQHGLPSGVDGATVLRGGVVWAQKSDGGVTVEPVTPRAPFLDRVRICNTGTPADSTGDVVAAVRRRLEADPPRRAALLDDMERQTRRLRRLLESAGAPPEAFVAPLRRFEAALEELGVVPAAVRRLVRRIEAAGGAAKISGAGTLRGDGAGSLLVYHPRPEAIDRRLLSGSLVPLAVRLGAAGVRRESDGGAATKLPAEDPAAS